MRYWLFKSEPFKFSWSDLKKKGARGEEWDGVRNYQARNNMREMKLGDLGFFYHSNEGKEIVGICEVCALAHQDSTTDDERWQCVDIKALADMPKPVTLAQVKQTEVLARMPLVTAMRLSVQPVPVEHWKLVCKMGGLDLKDLKTGKTPPNKRVKTAKSKPKPATSKAPQKVAKKAVKKAKQTQASKKNRRALAKG